MSIIKLQSNEEKRKGIYYEFDSSDEPLGVGGMGKVYKGLCINEKTKSSRKVAIKFMYDDLPEQVIERARREASIKVHNDNLVEMLGFIEIEGESVLGEIKKRYHVVSELLEGVMLDDLLQGKTTDHDGNEVLFAKNLYKDYINDPYHFATFLVRNILSGIMALHDAGYIHRDIDPTNIMVTSNGLIKLIDFGIAKKLSTLNTQDKALTTAGQFMGKAQYAAPELVLGDVNYQNRTTDIYAIGIIFFQFVVGHLPFEGATHEVLNMQIHKKMPIELIHQRKLREVIKKATNKKQELRYQSAAEFRVAVEQLEAKSIKQSDSSAFNINHFFKSNTKIAATISFIAIISICVYIFREPNSNPDPIIRDKIKHDTIIPHPVISYEQALSLLNDTSKADSGLIQMQSLSEKGDFNATYLLSRLYYKGEDYVDPSIKKIQKNCGIQCCNKKSHELMKEAVELNSNNYKALYELGTDYLAGEKRTGIPNSESRKLPKSYSLLSKALSLADKNGDYFYSRMIKKQISRIPAKYKR